MAIDLSKIDDVIAALQQVKLIAREHPAMLQLLEGFITSDSVAPKPAVNGHVRRGPGRPRGTSHLKGSLITSVRKVTESVDGRFTAAMIVDGLEARKFKFAAKNPNVAVNGALRKLTHKGELRVAKEGSGRRGNEYERVASGK
jgi:hypothetical protein